VAPAATWAMSPATSTHRRSCLSWKLRLRRALKSAMRWWATGTCCTLMWRWRTASAVQQSAAWAAQVGLQSTGPHAATHLTLDLLACFGSSAAVGVPSSPCAARCSLFMLHCLQAWGTKAHHRICRAVGACCPAGFGAAAFMAPLLQNLCLSKGDNEEACYCLKVRPSKSSIA
jgi:hypothetical protein